MGNAKKSAKKPSAKLSSKQKKLNAANARAARAGVKHLLIDGYNILHAWARSPNAPEPVGPSSVRTQFDAARERLIETVRAVRSMQAVQVTVVFDAGGAGTPGAEIEYPGGDAGFACVYTPTGMTADAVIEQLAHKYAARGLDVTVATQDVALGHSIQASGCYILSPAGLLELAAEGSKYQQKLMQHNQTGELKQKLRDKLI